MGFAGTAVSPEEQSLRKQQRPRKLTRRTWKAHRVRSISSGSSGRSLNFVLRTGADCPLTSAADTSQTTQALIQGPLRVFEYSRKGATERTETAIGESSATLFRIARRVSVQITPARIAHGAHLLRYHCKDCGGGRTDEQPGNHMGRDGLC